MSVKGAPGRYSCNLNTLRPRQNGRHFADNTFKRIFLNENARILIMISMKFVPKGPINNNPALVQIMAWRRLGDKPLSEPKICVTRPQWVKLMSFPNSYQGYDCFTAVKYGDHMALTNNNSMVMTSAWSAGSHYNDVIIGMMPSQITSLTIVYSTVYSDTDQRKHQSLHVTGLCAGNSLVTGGFPAQMASNMEIFPFDDVIMYCTKDWLGAHFTYDFLPAIQIRWKLRLAVIPLLAIRSQQIFAHATTAQLSCHVRFCSDHCIRIEMRVKRNFH